jgi:hypothetical protein
MDENISREFSYEDVESKGGLTTALRNALAKIGSGLQPVSADEREAASTSARVETASRFNDVFATKEFRSFTVDFWSKGVLLASTVQPSIAKIAQMCHAWHVDRFNTNQLAQQFAGIEIEPKAMAFESGNGVDWKWTQLASAEYIDKLGLHTLVVAASKHPVIRSLFPFTSLRSLRLSRCTGYPYSWHLPFVQRVGASDVFEVLKPLKRNRGVDVLVVHLGRGTAEEAVEVWATHLPHGIGPAIDGTEDDFRTSSI